MAHGRTPQLPEIFPTEGIRVDGEGHRYQTYEGDSGTVLEEREYTLDKAPVTEVEEVTGVLDGRAHTFVQGTDYVLSNDDERIVWQDDPADRPDAGSTFSVTYTCESIISRFLSSGEEEFKSIEDELNDIIQSKFIDEAEGDELDELGKVFGVLGKRSGRDDDQYRIYLKSVVQSFVSRGTKNGIKLAISAATEVPIDDITIDEDFQDNEYEVVVIPNTPITGSLLEEVAEIADPSGVSMVNTRFSTEPEEIASDDGVTIAEGQPVSDSMSVGDTADYNRVDFFDDAAIDDTNAIDPNKHTTSDSSLSDDTSAIDPNKNTASDSASSDDAVTFSTTATTWESNWGSFNWAGAVNE